VGRTIRAQPTNGHQYEATKQEYFDQFVQARVLRELP
jgi:hypothetical protein